MLYVDDSGVVIHSRILAIKYRIICDFPTFQVRVKARDANLNMAALLTTRAANRANELQGKIMLIHLEVLLRIR
jgi:hypothetical protein